MKLLPNSLVRPFLLAICAFSLHSAGLPAQVATSAAAHGTVILNREQTAAILPPSVFYRGQSAPVQGRNSAGIKLTGDKLVLFTLVDNSGYSTSIQQTYQAYLLTEVPLTLGGQSLPAGAYGFGFLGGNKLVVMDLGGTEVLHASTTPDPGLKRPNPLQIQPGTGSAQYKLYLGRSYVAFSPAAK